METSILYDIHENVIKEVDEKNINSSSINKGNKDKKLMLFQYEKKYSWSPQKD